MIEDISLFSNRKENNSKVMTIINASQQRLNLITAIRPVYSIRTKKITRCIVAWFCEATQVVSDARGTDCLAGGGWDATDIDQFAAIDGPGYKL